MSEQKKKRQRTYDLLNADIKPKFLWKSFLFNRTLNYIWWWDFISGDLGCVEYAFIIITSEFNLTQSGKYLLGSHLSVQ